MGLELVNDFLACRNCKTDGLGLCEGCKLNKRTIDTLTGQLEIAQRELKRERGIVDALISKEPS